MSEQRGGLPPPYGGLHPQNLLAVETYQTWARENRAGLAGSLVHTMDAQQAQAAADAVKHELHTGLDRLNLLYKLSLADRAVTGAVQSREAAAMDAASRKK